MRRARTRRPYGISGDRIENEFFIFYFFFLAVGERLRFRCPPSRPSVNKQIRRHAHDDRRGRPTHVDCPLRYAFLRCGFPATVHPKTISSELANTIDCCLKVSNNGRISRTHYVSSTVLGEIADNSRSMKKKRVSKNLFELSLHTNDASQTFKVKFPFLRTVLNPM